jgi:hypothetical protein
VQQQISTPDNLHVWLQQLFRESTRLASMDWHARRRQMIPLARTRLARQMN